MSIGCLTVPTRVSGTGSSWQFISGGRGQRAHGLWRLLTHCQSYAILRCWVRLKKKICMLRRTFVFRFTPVAVLIQSKLWKATLLLLLLAQAIWKNGDWSSMAHLTILTIPAVVCTPIQQCRIYKPQRRSWRSRRWRWRRKMSTMVRESHVYI